jgi:hypothetical protein
MWSILSHTTNDHKGPVLDAGNRAVSAGPFDPKDLLNGRLHPVVNRYSERLKDTGAVLPYVRSEWETDLDGVAEDNRECFEKRGEGGSAAA